MSEANQNGASARDKILPDEVMRDSNASVSQQNHDTQHLTKHIKPNYKFTPVNIYNSNISEGTEERSSS
jgi:hypothetical protein